MSGISGMVEKTVMGIMTAVVFLAVGVALGPTLLASAGFINATTLSGVPLADAIVLLGSYIGAFYYLALALGALTIVWGATKA